MEQPIAAEFPTPENFMRSTLLIAFIALLAILATFEIKAADPVGSAQTDREAAMQAQINLLEKQLESANQKITGLKSELQAAKTTDATTPESTTAAASVAAGTVAATPQASSESQLAVSSDTGMAGSEEMVDESVYKARTQEIAQEMYRIREPGPWEPASITQIREEGLNLGGVEDVSRLEFLAPGLRYGQTGHDVRLGMRGARSNRVGAEAPMVVGIYEDGVFVPTTTQGLDSLLDVQQIDVLRGPQNTSFGHHSYAGAISIITNKPTFDRYRIHAEAENGLPDKTRWRLALNLPVSDTVAFRLAGLSESRSGWINNNVIESDSDDLNDRKVQAMRASLLWQPNDRFSLLFRSRYQDENGTGSAPWGYQQTGAYINGELEPGNQFTPGGFRQDGGPWEVFRNYISAAEYEHWVNTLDLNWDAGFASLKWLTNFTSFHGLQSYDNDYTEKGENYSSPFAGWKTSQQTWSSEFRLTSNGDGPFDWLLGAYWFNRDADWGWLEAINGDLNQPEWDVDGTYSTDTTAVFGQVGYDFGEHFRVTGGLRRNEDKKKLKSGEKGSWSKTLWDAALEYRINEQMMSYFSVSSGYLAGGNNSAPGVNPSWDPEKLTAYEIGFKSMLADDELWLAAAAWYNDFKDVHSQSFLVLPFPGSPEATEYTGNGGDMNAKGLEVELQWSPTPQWNLATNITYTDAKFKDYLTAGLDGLGDIPGHTDGDTLSYRGWRPAMSPKWVVGVQGSYTFKLNRWGTLTPYIQSTYTGAYYASDINLPGVRQGSHTRTDFRLIYQTLNPDFEFQLYYLNGEDDAILNGTRVYNPAARPDITTLQANWANPNTYGIIFKYTY
jgi:iron complex outermembrane receptor protein